MDKARSDSGTEPGQAQWDLPTARATEARRAARGVPVAAVALALITGLGVGYAVGRAQGETNTSPTPSGAPTHSAGALPSAQTSPTNTPTAVGAALGQTLTASNGARYTAVAYRAVNSVDPRHTPPPGTSYHAVRVVICAGGQEEVITAFEVRLQLPSGAQLLPVAIDSSTGPMLDTAIVSPGQCADGWVYYAPPVAPAVVVIPQANLRWRIS